MSVSQNNQESLVVTSYREDRGRHLSFGAQEKAVMFWWSDCLPGWQAVLCDYAYPQSFYTPIPHHVQPEAAGYYPP